MNCGVKIVLCELIGEQFIKGEVCYTALPTDGEASHTEFLNSSPIEDDTDKRVSRVSGHFLSVKKSAIDEVPVGSVIFSDCVEYACKIQIGDDTYYIIHLEEIKLVL